MLKIENISYSVQGRQLFDEASAVIPTGHKVGIVGKNGAGKTTLFKLITKELALDGGTISVPKRSRIGGVAQEVPSSSTSLIDTVLAADTERLELLEQAETESDPNKIADIYTRLSDIDAWSAEARAATILKGLGFDNDEQLMPCSNFSGGWRMRVALAAVLFSAPDLLLLDEPTNYLDLEGSLWLENYLTRYPHTVLIISHDRGLLNRSVGAILHLDDQQLTFYQGPYDQFARHRAEQRAVQTAMAKKQEARKAHMQSFVDRFRAKASKAKQAQARLKMIERMDPISAPEDAAKQVFSFPEPEELSPPILHLENASVGYDGTAILSNLNLRIDQDDRIALLGKNGEGKSTLSKLLASRLHTISGEKTQARKLRVGFFAQHQVEELTPEDTPLQHLISALPGQTPSRLRARLAGFGLGPDQAETEVIRLSGGQKARLSLLLATLDAPHLLILDEPTNHLDIESREALVEALMAYSGAVILVSHDMHLLSLVADRLWLVKDGTVSVYQDDLETYRKLLLSTPASTPKAGKTTGKPSKKTEKQSVKPALSANAKSEIKACEDRLEKLEEMRVKLEEKLSDPEIYQPENAAQLKKWQDKQTELLNSVKRAEKLWETALSALE